MTNDELKTGTEILNEYFEKVSKDPELSKGVRDEIARLWQENKLYTKTSLIQALDVLRTDRVRDG